MFDGNVTAKNITATHQSAGGDLNINSDNDTVGRDQIISSGLTPEQLSMIKCQIAESAKKGNQQEMKKGFADVLGDFGANFVMSVLTELGKGWRF